MNGFAFYRKRAGLTTIKVGELLNIDPSTVTKWEKDGVLPRLYTLTRLCAIYGCTIDELVQNPMLTEVR